ncbi:HAD family acid phosphatase [Novosphingobium sp. ZN18A2]|uniref:HAD family acid phosphatase n=1 Tax=Novosphingobium sp. ZN18A2 TaxID=3079861 RepID=UPI0030D1490C
MRIHAPVAALCALALSACATAQTIDVPVPNSQIAPISVPPQMQFLYGSAEAAAVEQTGYNALVDAVAARKARKDAGTPAPADAWSAVLAPRSTLADPEPLACGDKPWAAVFDADETMLLNYGFEYDEATHPGRPFDPARWSDWEQHGAAYVSPVPGALSAVKALRAMGVTVIFNTNRSAANYRGTEAALDAAGLGPAEHLKTLYLQGDVDGKRGKDGRRLEIAKTYCVVAMAGDQLIDFSDLFVPGTPPRRRAGAMGPAIAAMWGRTWFAMPNPVYGSGVKGGIDDVFPADKRWKPKSEEQN